jgi:hypothetical protein
MTDFMTGNMPLGTPTLLTQLLVAVIRGGPAFGFKDVRDIAFLLRVSLGIDTAEGSAQHVQLYLNIVAHMLAVVPRNIIIVAQREFDEDDRFPNLLSRSGFLMVEQPEDRSDSRSRSQRAVDGSVTLRSLTGNVWLYALRYVVGSGVSEPLRFAPDVTNQTAQIELHPSALDKVGASVAKPALAVTAVYYDRDTFFRVNPTANVHDRPIFSVGLSGVKQIAIDEPIVSFALEAKSLASSGPNATYAVCEQRDLFSATARPQSAGTGGSDTECAVVENQDEWTLCSCNELRSFAVGLAVSSRNGPAAPSPSTTQGPGNGTKVLDTDERDAEGVKWTATLTVFFSLSIVLLAITVSSFFLFKPLRQYHRRFLVVNFAVATMLAQVCMLLERTATSRESCVVVASSISVFGMASLNWMLINVYILYASHVRHNHKVESIISDNTQIFFGWAVPLMFSMLGVILNQSGAAVDGLGGDGNDGACWPEGTLFWALSAAPTIIVCCLIFCLLCRIGWESSSTRTLGYRHKQKNRHLVPDSDKVKVVVRGTGIYTCLLIVCWASMAAAVQHTDQLGYQYVAAITGLLVGGLLFLHQCILCRDVRSAWHSALPCLSGSQAFGVVGLPEATPMNSPYAKSFDQQLHSRLDWDNGDWLLPDAAISSSTSSSPRKPASASPVPFDVVRQSPDLAPPADRGRAEGSADSADSAEAFQGNLLKPDSSDTADVDADADIWDGAVPVAEPQPQPARRRATQWENLHSTAASVAKAQAAEERHNAPGSGAAEVSGGGAGPVAGGDDGAVGEHDIVALQEWICAGGERDFEEYYLASLETNGALPTLPEGGDAGRAGAFTMAQFVRDAARNGDISDHSIFSEGNETPESLVPHSRGPSRMVSPITALEHQLLTKRHASFTC